MSQSVTTPFGRVKIPGGYGSAKVVSSPSGFATTGVVAVLGEAAQGVDFSLETSLGKNAFGPDQADDVRAKYGSGPLVDGVLAVINASNDDNIVGAVNRVIPVKLNSSVSATGTLSKIGGGSYATLTATPGKSGNLVNFKVDSSTAEVVPTTGAILIAPPQVSTVAAFRANGAAVVTTTLSAAQLPSSIASAIDGLAGVAATGGTNRSVITAVAGTLSCTVDSGFQVHFTISTAWANVPTVGDLLYAPTGSPFAVANEGTYVVTAATSTRIDAYKLLDAAGTGAQRTAPTTESGLAVAATTDLQAFAPTVISLEAGAVSAGLGKSLEVANSGSGLLSDVAFKFASATASPPASAYTGISTSAVPTALTSSAEYGVKVTVSRQSDSVSDAVTVNGAVVLTIGYTGTTASMTIGSGLLTTTVVGGSGANLSLTLSDYATLADLCTFISTQAGYTAAPATAALGQTSPSRLDAGTYGIATSQGAKTGRVKADGALFAEKALFTLATVSPVSPATALVGLPATAVVTFLAGGSRGGTSNATVVAALAALEKVRCNFVVVYMDSDATADIAAGVTDSSSTYDIASVAANLTSHVVAMSGFKRRRRRQGFIGYAPSTFDAARQFSANIAAYEGRVAVAFESVRDTDSTGTIRTIGPKHLAAKCAGMQAAAGAEPIVDKFIKISGVLPVSGFDPDSDSDLESAMDAGLLIAVEDERGGFRWVIDQTTYVKDENFVYNSVGNLYNLDVVLTGFFTRLQQVFNGHSTADVTAAAVKTAAERYLQDAFDARLLAPSDEFGKGFGNLKVRIEAPALKVSAKIVLATGILFEIVDLEVVPATSTA